MVARVRAATRADSLFTHHAPMRCAATRMLSRSRWSANDPIATTAATRTPTSPSPITIMSPVKSKAIASLPSLRFLQRDETHRPCQPVPSRFEALDAHPLLTARYTPPGGCKLAGGAEHSRETSLPINALDQPEGLEVISPGRSPGYRIS